MNWKNKKYILIIGRIIIFLFLFGGITIAAILMTLDTEKKKSKTLSEYPLIEKINKEIKGIIVGKTWNTGLGGTDIIELDSGDKFRVGAGALYISKNANKGDSIYKAQNSDTVFIIQSKEIKYYILR